MYRHAEPVRTTHLSPFKTSRRSYSRWGASSRTSARYGATNIHSWSETSLGYGFRVAMTRCYRLRAKVHNTLYLDDPPTEGNPNAVLVVTQNWNPGGSDHLERTNGGKVAINRNRCRPSARRSARNRIPTRTALGFTLGGFCQKQVKGLPSPKPRTRRGRRSA